MSEDYERKIERGLKLYLREEHGVEVANEPYLSGFNESGNDGCDTCGWGSSGATFDIDYWDADDGREWVTIEKDPLEFFAILLPYIDRAN